MSLMYEHKVSWLVQIAELLHIYFIGCNYCSYGAESAMSQECTAYDKQFTFHRYKINLITTFDLKKIMP